MSAVGRPIPTAAMMQAHLVGVQGQTDIIWNPLYDFLAYPSAGSTLFTFFATAQGAGLSSAPGAGAVAKTAFDTNLTINNQLTMGNAFYGVRSETLFYPGIGAASATPGVEIGRANAPTTVGIFANDVWAVLNGGLKVLAIGTDRKYINDGPLSQFPPCTRMALAAALSGDAITTAGQEICYAAASGEPYRVVDLYLQSNQQFTLTYAFAAAIPTPSQQIARIGERFGGYLIRQAT